VTQNVYEPQALNRNSYVLNNPLFYTDPTGFSKWTTFRDKWLKPAVAIAVAWNVGGPLFNALKTAWTASASSAVATWSGTTLAGIASGSLVGGINGVIFNGPRGFAIGARMGAIGGAITGSFAAFMPVDASVTKQMAASVLAGGTTSVLQGGSFGDGLKGVFVGMALQYAVDLFTYEGYYQNRYASREELLADLGSDGYAIGERGLGFLRALFRADGGSWLDKHNLELLHQQLFFEEGGVLRNLGFFGGGVGVAADSGFPGNIARYRFSPVLHGPLTVDQLTSIPGFRVQDYNLIFNNCQDFVMTVQLMHGQ
jgi:hypothetical protein